MDKVLIKNLSVRGIIGINDWEREKKQEILINITLYADLSRAGESDKITDTVNYRTITKRIIAHAETAERFTVEALANDLINICMEESGISGAKVRVEKPGAVRFSDSVGVEIERGETG